MSELGIKISLMEGKVPVTVLHVTGSIDANSVQELDAKAEEVLEVGGNQHILLDLSAVEYMSSAGFRAMHKIYTALHARDDGSCLKLLNPSDEIKRLMKAMGFDTRLPAFDDLTTAISAF